MVTLSHLLITFTPPSDNLESKLCNKMTSIQSKHCRNNKQTEAKTCFWKNVIEELLVLNICRCPSLHHLSKEKHSKVSTLQSSPLLNGNNYCGVNLPRNAMEISLFFNVEDCRIDLAMQGSYDVLLSRPWFYTKLLENITWVNSRPIRYVSFISVIVQ